jgi:hypothetical protein
MRLSVTTLLVAAASAEPSEADCRALGFAPSLLCGSCTKLGEFVGVEDSLVAECEACCTAEESSASSYARATFDICK